MCGNLAVLDADFLNKINAIRSANPDELFLKLMTELSCSPVVHPFVAEELFNCGLAQRMLAAGHIRKIGYDEFLPNERRSQYDQSFRELYHILTLAEYGIEIEPDDDIFSRHAGKSYGEVHSILMASQLKIPVFYSNDHSGKILCKRFRNLRAETMNDIHEALKGRTGCSITSKEWKYLLHTR